MAEMVNIFAHELTQAQIAYATLSSIALAFIIIPSAFIREIVEGN